MVRSKSWKRSCESRSERRIERPALLTTKSIGRQLGGQLLAERVDRLEVGEVAGVDVGACRRAASIVGLGVLELVLAAGDQDRDAAGLGDLERGDLADAGRGAGDHDVLARRARSTMPRVAGGVDWSRCSSQ